MIKWIISFAWIFIAVANTFVLLYANYKNPITIFPILCLLLMSLASGAYLYKDLSK